HFMDCMRPKCKALARSALPTAIHGAEIAEFACPSNLEALVWKKNQTRAGIFPTLSVLADDGSFGNRRAASGNETKKNHPCKCPIAPGVAHVSGRAPLAFNTRAHDHGVVAR